MKRNLPTFCWPSPLFWGSHRSKFAVAFRHVADLAHQKDEHLSIVINRVALTLVMCMSTFVATGAVLADEVADKELAQKLFAEGMAAIQAGDQPAGCAKLKDSMKLFVVANTLFNVAQCEERDGHLVAALDYWQRGLGLVEEKDPRAKVASERIDALSPRVPRVRVVIPPGQTATTVLLDDVEIPEAALSRPLPLDAGRHSLVVRVAGHQDRRYELILAEKERTEFVATPGPATVVEKPAASASASSSVSIPPPPPPSNGQRTAGFVVGGVGVAAFIVAGVTGGLVPSKSDALATCRSNSGCVNEAELLTAYRAVLVTNAVAFGVGVAGVGAGLVMILTAPKAGEAVKKGPNASIVPMVVPGGGGLGVLGRF